MKQFHENIIFTHTTHYTSLTVACPCRKAGPKKPSKSSKAPPKQPHIETPQKARIQGLAKDHSQSEICKIIWDDYHKDWPQPPISRAITDDDPRRTGHTPIKPETRGRKRKFNDAELNRFEKAIEEHPDTKWMGWREAIGAADNDLMGSKWEWVTVKKRLLERDDIGKFIAVQKEEVPEYIARKRVILLRRL